MKDVKFIPLREAASFAESRSVRGMRMVTETSEVYRFLRHGELRSFR